MDLICTMFLAIVVFGAYLMNLGPGKNHPVMMITHNYLSTNILSKEKSGKKSYFKTNI